MSILAFLMLSAAPASDPSTWIGADDYPSVALAARAEGVTSVRLDITQQGAPVKCTITNSSGNAELDEASCQLLMKRAQFRASSNSTDQIFSTNVQWKIPPVPLTPVNIMGFTATSRVKNGEVQSGCNEKKLGAPDEDLPLCELFSSDLFTEAVDKIPLDKASLMQARLVFGPADGPLPYDTNFSKEAIIYTFMEASFDVDQHGIGTNCRIVQNQIGPDVAEFCESFSAEQEFDVKNVSSFPLKMRFVIDLMVE